jgi:hypothetical protein
MNFGCHLKNISVICMFLYLYHHKTFDTSVKQAVVLHKIFIAECQMYKFHVYNMKAIRK